jgi:hypothetical protein
MLFHKLYKLFLKPQVVIVSAKKIAPKRSRRLKIINSEKMGKEIETQVNTFVKMPSIKKIRKKHNSSTLSTI